MTTVQDIIRASAARHGIDPQAMLRIGQIESGLDPAAQNPTSSAGGLFQFIDSTWGDYGRGRNKLDAGSNADAAGAYLSDTSAHLARALGRRPEGWELYAGHQQGPGGATSLFSADPNALASSLVGPDAIRLNGGTADMSVGDFLSIWRNKYNGTSVPAGSATVTGTVPAPSQNPASLAALFDVPNPVKRRDPEQRDNRSLAELIQY